MAHNLDSIRKKLQNVANDTLKSTTSQLLCSWKQSQTSSYQEFYRGSENFHICYYFDWVGDGQDSSLIKRFRLEMYVILLEATVAYALKVCSSINEKQTRKLSGIT